MKRISNTIDLWDKLWQGSGYMPPTVQTLITEQRSVRWHRIIGRVKDHFGSIKGKKVIELGSGMGTYAALFATEGVKVTLVDYSPKALDLAKKFFTSLQLPATYVLADITKMPSSLRQSFDISTSCGVAEHFLGKKRENVLKSHFDVLANKGMTFIMVPNSRNFPYRTYKSVAELGGFWPWGEEHPFTQQELAMLAKKNSATEYGFFGDSFLWSLNYCNPFSLLGKKISWFKRFNIPQTIPTCLDKTFAYSLGLWATV